MNGLLTRARSGVVLRALGLMSGTSLDGVDVALIETDGEQVQAFGPWLTVPYSEEVRDAVRRVLGAEVPSADTERASWLVTQAHREAIGAFLEATGSDAAGIDVVGFHGQTITHRPERRFTWQIGDAAPLARDTGIPVVGDFRSADVAAGGEGAPLVPLYHQALVRRAVASGQLRLPLAVLNIGGVANVTWVGEGDALLAFDTGPGNAPLDDWVRQHGAGPFDRDGRLAAAGRPDRARIQQLLSSSFFSKNPPKSLDRNDFSLHLAEGLSLADGAATLAHSCAEAAAQALRHMPRPPTAWVVCGGGSKNPTLLKILEEVSKISVQQDNLGWSSDAMEAQAFAYLAVRSLRGLPLSLPATTGVPRPMPGGRLHMP